MSDGYTKPKRLVQIADAGSWDDPRALLARGWTYRPRSVLMDEVVVTITELRARLQEVEQERDELKMQLAMVNRHRDEMESDRDRQIDAHSRTSAQLVRMEGELEQAREALLVAADDLDKAANQFGGRSYTDAIGLSPNSDPEVPRMLPRDRNAERFAEKAARARAAASSSREQEDMSDELAEGDDR